MAFGTTPADATAGQHLANIGVGSLLGMGTEVGTFQLRNMAQGKGLEETGTSMRRGVTNPQTPKGQPNAPTKRNELFKNYMDLENKHKVDLGGSAEARLNKVDKAYNMIANLKGRFQKIARDCLRRHVGSDAEVDDEINHFIQIFSRSTPRC